MNEAPWLRCSSTHDRAISHTSLRPTTTLTLANHTQYTGALNSYLEESGVNTESDQRPRILLMGSRRAGKSSIQKVVFHKMSPHETLFLGV
jgi:predicted AAA+ superfamily ATPase